jgi:lipopolysaccharide export system protein LptA
LLVAAVPAAAAEALSGAAVSPKTEGSIGVVSFESAGATRQSMPDVAILLAQRLSTRGVERVVGPDELSIAAVADPTPDQIVSWADEADVEALVVGRTTRIGSRLSVDARLHGATTGEQLGSPFYAEVARLEDLAGAVDDLTGKVLERLASVAPAQPVASAPSKARAPSPYRREEPIDIQADELEAITEDDRKRFLFVGNVRAEQGPVALKADRLEAFYPPGSSELERLIATGHVIIDQKDRTVFCDRATLVRAQDRIVCTGNARIEQDCDRVSGHEIIFHLDTEVLKVNGAADVQINPDDAKCVARAGAAR